jgi:hypothetical protein
VFFVLAAAVSFTTWVGCGGDDDDSNNNGGGGGATTSSFAGWFANGNESGQLGVTVSVPNLARRLMAPGVAAHEVGASGTMTLTGGGGVVALTGTFDDETGDLSLTGGGYTFTGIYDVGPPGGLFGSYTGPNGGGQFSATSGGTSGTQVYGGQYQSDDANSSGTFLMAIRGGLLEGAAVEDGDSLGIYFSGTVTGTGTTRAIAFTASDGTEDVTGTGTLDTGTNHVSGRYLVEFSATPVDSGSWSGDLVTP